MRKTLLASASAVALTCGAVMPAHAAPPAPVYSWTGFYFGGNIGAGVGDSNPFNIANFNAAPFGIAGTQPFAPSLGVQGFGGGGQFGYTMQTGDYVYGFETDFTGLDVHGTASASPFFTGKGTNSVTWSSRYSWLYTARLRGGITINGNWLIYGTGGVAVTSVHDIATCTSAGSGCGNIGPFGPQFVQWSQTSTLVGGVFGGGIETMPFPNWIVGLKVLHAIFPTASPHFIGVNTNGNIPVPAAFSFDHNLTLITFEVDYKFGGP